MGTETDKSRSKVMQLATVLLDDVDGISERAAARMQELLPAYAHVPREQLVPVIAANTRNLLEFVRDPEGGREQGHATQLASGATRARQGITSDEMLNAWRIGLEVVREEAHIRAGELGIGEAVLLEFVVTTLQWGDAGMRASAAAHHEAEIRELGRLVAEQAALRRVAVLVAHSAPPGTVFDAVAAETLTLMGADAARICRYEPDGTATVLAERNTMGEPIQAGTRLTLEGDSVTAKVLRTRLPSRRDSFARGSGTVSVLARERGLSSAAGAPIVVEGGLWGVVVAHWSRSEPLQADAETRINEFAELVATAIANANSRDQLTASRARLLTEADRARRRIVRDLHDGAQQRLLQTIVTLKLAERALATDDGKAAELMSEALAHAQQGNIELRELAHGMFPAVLSQGGLRSGVSAIVSRLDLPVEIDIPRERFPAEIEANAYFVVSEALTNVVKHAEADWAEVRASVKDGVLQLEVRDNGVGGANPRGHGLVGLSDRVAALDGQLSVESPAEGGTILAATLPLLASVQPK
jgi:signal transduction histidine kinase